MTESRTPICDLIENLLSRELSRGTLGQALAAARPVEAALARGSRTTDEKREIERARKARYRQRVAAESRGTTAPDILTKDSSNSRSSNKKVSKEESAVPLSRGTTDDWPDDYLDVFWKQYPSGRKTGKKAVAAKLAGIRKRREVTFATLMLGVSRYAATSPEPRYTKAPEVWLNKGCWDDEIAHAATAPDAMRGNGYAALMLRRRGQRDEEHATVEGEGHGGKLL